MLDGLKRNMSRGNSLSDELDLSSVLGDTRAYLYSPVGGSYSEPKGNSSRREEEGKGEETKKGGNGLETRVRHEQQ